MAQDLSPTTAYFSADGEQFAHNYETNACFKDRLQLFRSAVQQSTPAGAKVLDFGCGPGIISLSIAQLGYNVLGLDGAAGMITTARARAQSLQIQNASFDHVDVTQFDATMGSFDAIVCSSVLEYIEDDMGLLKKLVQSLRPGGHLFLSVPHRGNVFAPLEPLAHRIKLLVSPKAIRHLVYSRHRYTRSLMTARLQELGMENLDCTSFECPVLGSLGVRLSRCSLFARMFLLEAAKLRSVAKFLLNNCAFHHP